MMDQLLTIIIPAYNESGSLPEVLSSIYPMVIEKNFKVIIVNDGSTDSTKQLLMTLVGKFSFTCIEHKTNKGYGAAIKTGIRAADTEYAITIDADGQHRAQDILSLFETIKDSDYDLIVGGRLNQKNGTLARGVGKSAIRSIVKILIKVPVYDINSGMKIYRTELAKNYIRLAPDSMAFSDIMTISFVYFGKLVKEVPISINKRIAGKSSINYSTGIDTIKEIMFIATVFAPYKFFSLLSISILLITLSWGIPFIFLGKGITSATASGILISVVLWSLGVLAQLISGIRRDMIEN